MKLDEIKQELTSAMNEKNNDLFGQHLIQLFNENNNRAELIDILLHVFAQAADIKRKISAKIIVCTVLQCQHAYLPSTYSKTALSANDIDVLANGENPDANLAKTTDTTTTCINPVLPPWPEQTTAVNAATKTDESPLNDDSSSSSKATEEKPSTTIHPTVLPPWPEQPAVVSTTTKADEPHSSDDSSFSSESTEEKKSTAINPVLPPWPTTPSQTKVSAISTLPRNFGSKKNRLTTLLQGFQDGLGSEDKQPASTPSRALQKDAGLFGKINVKELKAIISQKLEADCKRVVAEQTKVIRENILNDLKTKLKSANKELQTATENSTINHLDTACQEIEIRIISSANKIIKNKQEKAANPADVSISLEELEWMYYCESTLTSRGMQTNHYERANTLLKKELDALLANATAEQREKTKSFLEDTSRHPNDSTDLTSLYPYLTNYQRELDKIYNDKIQDEYFINIYEQLYYGNKTKTNEAITKITALLGIEYRNTFIAESIEQIKQNRIGVQQLSRYTGRRIETMQDSKRPARLGA